MCRILIEDEHADFDLYVLNCLRNLGNIHLQTLQISSAFSQSGKVFSFFFFINFSKFLPERLNFYKTWSASHTYFATTACTVV